MRHRALLVMTLATSMGAGCARMSMRGVVSAQPTCNAVKAVPADEATVTVTCPDRPTLTAKTDSLGRFIIPLEDELPSGCDVQVSQPGFHTYSRPIAALCVRESTDEWPDCYAASLVAELSPTSEATP